MEMIVQLPFNKEKFKETFDKTTVITIIVLWLMAGLFYWYAYRPTVIRKGCHASAVNDSRARIKSKDGYYQEDYNFYYNQCFHEKGLK